MMRIWRLNGHQLPEMPSLGHGLTCRRHVRYLGFNTKYIDDMTWNENSQAGTTILPKFFEKLWDALILHGAKVLLAFF